MQSAAILDSLAKISGYVAQVKFKHLLQKEAKDAKATQATSKIGVFGAQTTEFFSQEVVSLEQFIKDCYAAIDDKKVDSLALTKATKAAFARSSALLITHAYKANVGSGLHRSYKGIKFREDINFNNLNSFIASLESGNGTVGHQLLHEFDRRFSLKASNELSQVQSAKK